MAAVKPVAWQDRETARALLEILPQPLVVIGADDKIAAVSSEAETFFGSSAAMLARHRLTDLFPLDHPIVGLVDKVRRSGASINEYALDLSGPRTGQHPNVDVFARPAADGTIVLLLVQRAMATMIERQLSHRSSARTITGLAALLAHEIKNPLSGIRGAAQLLSSDVDDSGRQLTSMIQDETDRIVALVDRMAAIGDVGPPSRETVNIHSVLDHVKQVAAAGFAEGITITEAYDPSLPPLSGNRDRLIQAFLNLVKNAAESLIGPPGAEGRGYRPAGARIVLRTAFRPAMRMANGSGPAHSLPLMVAVEDNGPGIPDSVLAALFEPFVTTKPAGSGLGLALVASVVAEHGGVIRIEHERGFTVFRMFFPVAGGNG